MDEARSALDKAPIHGTVFRSDQQTAGRGRVPGRAWVDQGAQSLLFTIVLHRNRVPAFPPLTQVMALGLCRWLEEEYDLAPRLKWPNDVLVEGGKIAGILVEGQGDVYLGGLGLNLGHRDFPADLRTPATSLEACLSQERPLPSAAQALPGLLQSLLDALEDPGADDLSRRLQGLGEPTTLLLGDPSRQERLSGRLEGLGDDGALLLRDDNGRLHSIYSGEIEKT